MDSSTISSLLQRPRLRKNATSLQREVVRLKRELGAVSAQDDFARWAKLQRQHDKVLNEYQKIGTYASAHQFPSLAAQSWLTEHFVNRWQSTNTQDHLPVRYFDPPLGWHPRPPLHSTILVCQVTHVLDPRGLAALPMLSGYCLSRGRRVGSVSINIWGIACASMIALVGEAITATYVLITKKPLPVGEKQERWLSLRIKGVQ